MVNSLQRISEILPPIIEQVRSVLKDMLTEGDGKPYGYIKVNFQAGRLTTIEKNITYKLIENQRE